MTDVTSLPWAALDGETVVLLVHAVPGARRAAVIGPHGDALKVAVTARAADGAANAMLLDVLADAAGVHRSAVALVAGHASRRKRVRVTCTTAVAAQTVLQRLSPLPPSTRMAAGSPGA